MDRALFLWVRPAEGAATARTLGVVDQTLFNWVKAHRQGKLVRAERKAVSAEQMEISRLRAERRMRRVLRVMTAATFSSLMRSVSICAWARSVPRRAGARSRSMST